MRRAALALCAVLLAACATPLEAGEERYRQGDRLGALAVWRTAAPDHRDRHEIERRVEEVQAEYDRLVVGYLESGAAAEAEGRLAESVLDYRLALELRPETETLAHVQTLARQLADEKRQLREEYDRVLAQGDLETAKQALAKLRTLDPFDPEYENQERQLQAAIQTEWRRQRANIRAAQAGEVEALVEAGRLAFGEEKLETALSLWRRALLIDPDNDRVSAYIARAERQLDSLRRLRAEPGEPGGR